MIAFRVYFYFFKGLLLKNSSKNLKYQIAINSILNSHTFRVSENVNKHRAPFTFFLSSVRLLFFKKKNNLVNNKPAIYCQIAKNVNYCYTYYQTFNKDTNEINVIVRDEPFSSTINFLDKTFIILINACICIYVFITSYFQKNSNKKALLPLELVESVLLLAAVKKHNIPYIYFFSSFEKDANWIALLLQHHKIHCHKIPSSNPIKNFYSKVIADKFLFTAPFQLHEYPKLKKNWCVNSFELWPIFGAHNLLNYTIEKKGSANFKSIGIYTRGIWLRKKRGDNFLGVGEDLAEEKMLEYMRDYLNKSEEIYNVYILLHPTEKSTVKQYEESVVYYKGFFGERKINFVEANFKSYESFNFFDLGIASISSVIFERLFCGYKCLLAPIDIEVKLYEDPNLENIIVKNQNEFFIKMKEILALSNSDYFEKYNLNEYRFTEIKKINLNN